MSTPLPRYTMTVEFSPRPGETPQQAIEWLQKNLDFYHGKLNAKVRGRVEITAAEQEPAPTIDESLL